MKVLLTRKFWHLLAGAIMFIGASTATAQSPGKFNGLGTLLTPDNCALLLIDHQPFQFGTLGSTNSQNVLNNVIGLAKTAKVFKVPTLLTSVVEDRGGYMVKGLTDVFQAELQRDWARTETIGPLVPILSEHMGSIGSNIAWEFQLLNEASKKK